MFTFSYCVALLFVTLLGRGTSYEGQDVCPSDGESMITLDAKIHQNATGHRSVSINVQHGSQRLTGERNRTQLHVTHDSTVCGKMERIELKATVVFFEPIISRRTDYDYFPGVGSYKLHKWGRTWEDARITCLEEDAHLVVINSEEEANIAKKYVSQFHTFQNIDDPLQGVFVGVTDRDREGVFTAVTGERLEDTGYAKWAPGEPTKNDGGQNFVAIEKNGYLHDINNPAKMAFVCELK